MDGCGCHDASEQLERSTLRWLLAINAVMFAVESLAGWIGESTGLLADSLDMLADASVYGISLFAVGRSARLQRNAARASGWLQIGLGAGVLLEVTRRFLLGSEPVSLLMMVIGGVALTANLICLALLAKHRRGGIHMRASWIFSTNDVIVNCGVIASGLMVWGFESRYPDLLIGTIVSSMVIAGGRKILREVAETTQNE